jgi:hypothetical protein
LLSINDINEKLEDVLGIFKNGKENYIPIVETLVVIGNFCEGLGII